LREGAIPPGVTPSAVVRPRGKGLSEYGDDGEEYWVLEPVQEWSDARRKEALRAERSVLSRT